MSKISRRQMLVGVPAAGTFLSMITGQKVYNEEYAKNRYGDRMIDRYPEFKDGRSKKVIFIAHCIINQNARIEKCGYTPASIPKIPEFLLERGIGIIQMPCPELNCLGLGRGGGAEPEIYDMLSTPGNRQMLKNYAGDIIHQIKQYRKQNFKVVGILGLDGSPSCGVDTHWYESDIPGSGAFMEELKDMLKKEGLEDVPLKGVRDSDPDRALKIIGEWDQ